MATIEGFYFLTLSKGEVLAHHCSKCKCSHIIGDNCPARVFHCGRWEEYKPEKPTGLRALFSNGPAALPRVRFKETPIRRLTQREDVAI
jgi:hypothetical protein